MVKIYGVIWFIDTRGLIGIVTMNNGYEDKAYIGIALDKDEKSDIDYILKHGSKFPFKQAIELTGR